MVGGLRWGEVGWGAVPGHGQAGTEGKGCGRLGRQLACSRPRPPPACLLPPSLATSLPKRTPSPPRPSPPPAPHSHARAVGVHHGTRAAGRPRPGAQGLPHPGHRRHAGLDLSDRALHRRLARGLVRPAAGWVFGGGQGEGLGGRGLERRHALNLPNTVAPPPPPRLVHCHIDWHLVAGLGWVFRAGV